MPTREEILDRVEHAMREMACPSPTQDKIQGPPQDEDRMAQELDITKQLYALLEPMERTARDRVLAHAIGFLQEQDLRERDDMAAFREMEQAPAQMPAYPPPQTRRRD
jgi:hypothetical protein